jgi:hypothetical protein
VDFYGNYSFRYLWQKRLHFWSYSHHPFYLQRGALSIKHDLQTRPSNLGFTHLEDMDKSHLYLRSNRSWNGIRTDEFESNYTVVDHPILRPKAL